MPSIFQKYEAAPKGDNFRRPDNYDDSYIDRSFVEAAAAASSNKVVNLQAFFQSTNKQTYVESKNTNPGSVPQG